MFDPNNPPVEITSDSSNLSMDPNNSMNIPTTESFGNLYGTNSGYYTSETYGNAINEPPYKPGFFQQKYCGVKVGVLSSMCCLICGPLCGFFCIGLAILFMVVGPISRQTWMSVFGGLFLPLGIVTITFSIIIGIFSLIAWGFYAGAKVFGDNLKKPLVQYDYTGNPDYKHLNTDSFNATVYGDGYYQSDSMTKEKDPVVHDHVDSNLFYQSAPDTTVNVKSTTTQSNPDSNVNSQTNDSSNHNA